MLLHWQMRPRTELRRLPDVVVAWWASGLQKSCLHFERRITQRKTKLFNAWQEISDDTGGESRRSYSMTVEWAEQRSQASLKPELTRLTEEREF